MGIRKVTTRSPGDFRPMVRFVLFLVAFLCLGILPISAGESPVGLVKSMYESREKVPKIFQFSSFLTAGFRKDWLQGMLKNNSRPVFDADPVIGLQAAGVKDLEVLLESQSNNRAVVLAKFLAYQLSPTEEGEPAAARYTLLKEKGRWLIDDVAYPLLKAERFKSLRGIVREAK
jgi:hypothetical protein